MKNACIGPVLVVCSVYAGSTYCLRTDNESCMSHESLIMSHMPLSHDCAVYFLVTSGYVGVCCSLYCRLTQSTESPTARGLWQSMGEVVWCNMPALHDPWASCGCCCPCWEALLLTQCVRCGVLRQARRGVVWLQCLWEGHCVL